MLQRDNHELYLESLVVNELDVDILAGIPFMTSNDISLRPAKHQIVIGNSNIIHYGQTNRNATEHRIRRTQVFVLRSAPSSTVVWPGSFVEVDIPSVLDPESTLAVEPRCDRSTKPTDWPHPNIIEAIGGKIRIVNNTHEPQTLRKNEHFCQIRLTSNIPDVTETVQGTNSDTVTPRQQANTTSTHHTDTIHLDPDKILPEETRHTFRRVLQQFDDVFDQRYKGYHGAAGQFQANINMGPVQPPQRKGRVPQYAKNNLVALQEKCDELEALGVLRKPEDIGVTVEYQPIVPCKETQWKFSPCYSI